LLAANLVDRRTGSLPAWKGLRASTHVRVRDLDVGVVGVLTRETPSIVMPAWFAGLEVAPLAPAIEREARLLRGEGARLVIVTAHAGGKCREVGDPRDIESCDADQELFEVARALPPGIVDAMIGGHTHAQVAHFVNGIPLAEAWSRGRGFSRIDLTLRGKRTEAHIAPPTELCVAPASCTYEGRPVVASAAVSAVIAPALAAAETTRARPLGVMALAPFAHEQTRESALGNLFATLMLEGAPDADAAIVNGGGLRAGLPAGPIGFGHVYELCPFDNAFTSVELSATELAALLARHFSHDRHGQISIAGLHVISACSKAGLGVALLRADGRPVPPDTRLRIVTSDYLATGGDELFGELAARPERRRIDTRLLRDVLATSLARRGGSIDPASFFDATRPRIALPSARPVRCE
jgi:2',3'-cyclic-nucleotide 2'-phosphodiesterase (5'-nucleotidase family)